ncbi:uncharacterized protein B0P05DRAFT_500552 [Gilbertella persicaria]|uniref:uncharacterized protein n=1 Tax=Gilbertella persicaria TaxID=101096 RepID=UPI00221FF220|nr:uncharacterized protein B0P05DRAFT_500552 [Gilbertella persicaria]KAI8048034.1 hypothetical protein B0P05DRAFT_500552 [Gilbertella persicaria]
MSSQYIVTFKRDTPSEVIEEKIKEVESSGAKIVHRYDSAIKGFSVSVPDESVNALSFDSDHITGVEADGEVTTQGKALIAK